MIRGCGLVGCILFSCKQECGTGVYANILFIKAHGIYSPAGGGRGRKMNNMKRWSMYKEDIWKSS